MTSDLEEGDWVVLQNGSLHLFWMVSSPSDGSPPNSPATLELQDLSLEAAGNTPAAWLELTSAEDGHVGVRSAFAGDRFLQARPTAPTFAFVSDSLSLLEQWKLEAYPEASSAEPGHRWRITLTSAQIPHVTITAVATRLNSKRSGQPLPTQPMTIFNTAHTAHTPYSPHPIQPTQPTQPMTIFNTAHTAHTPYSPHPIQPTQPTQPMTIFDTAASLSTWPQQQPQPELATTQAPLSNTLTLSPTHTPQRVRRMSTGIPKQTQVNATLGVDHTSCGQSVQGSPRPRSWPMVPIDDGPTGTSSLTGSPVCGKGPVLPLQAGWRSVPIPEDVSGSVVPTPASAVTTGFVLAPSSPLMIASPSSRAQGHTGAAPALTQPQLSPRLSAPVQGSTGHSLLAQRGSQGMSHGLQDVSHGAVGVLSHRSEGGAQQQGGVSSGLPPRRGTDPQMAAPRDLWGIGAGPAPGTIGRRRRASGSEAYQSSGGSSTRGTWSVSGVGLGPSHPVDDLLDLSQRVMKGWVARLNRAPLYVAFKLWMGQARRSKAGMQRAEEHATWHIKRRAIQGWCWCLYRRHQKHAWGRQIQRLAVRRQRAALSGTFHWWHVFTSYSRDRAAMIGVLRHQTDQASLRMCWRAWQGHVDRSRVSFELAAHHHCRACLRQALHAWHSVSCDAPTSVQPAPSSHARLTRKVLRAWSAWALRRRWCDRMVTRLVKRRCWCDQHAVFTAWLDLTAHTCARVRVVEAARAARVFHAWRTHRARRIVRARIAAAADALYACRLTRRVFDAWWAVAARAQDRASQADQLARQRTVALLATALTGWATWVGKLVASKRLCATRRRKHAACALRAWHEHSARRRWTHKRADTHVAQRQLSTLRMAFAAWLATTVTLEPRCGYTTSVAQAMAAPAAPVVVSPVGQLCTPSKAPPAAGMWQETVAATPTHVAQRLMVVETALRKGRLRRALRAWHAAAARRGYGKRAVKQALALRRRRRLAACIAALHAAAQHTKWVTTHVNSLVQQRALWLLSALVRDWSALAKTTRQFRAACNRMCQMRGRQTQAKCLAAWRGAVQQGKKDRRFLASIVIEHQRRVVRGCFRTWRLAVADTKGRHQLAMDLTVRHRKRRLRSVLLVWRQQALATADHYRSTVRHMVASRRARQAKSVLRAWAAVAVSSVQSRQDFPWMCRVFYSWLHWVQHRRDHNSISGGEDTLTLPTRRVRGQTPLALPPTEPVQALPAPPAQTGPVAQHVLHGAGQVPLQAAGLVLGVPVVHQAVQPVSHAGVAGHMASQVHVAGQATQHTHMGELWGAGQPIPGQVPAHVRMAGLTSMHGPGLIPQGAQTGSWAGAQPVAGLGSSQASMQGTGSQGSHGLQAWPAPAPLHSQGGSLRGAPHANYNPAAHSMGMPHTHVSKHSHHATQVPSQHEVPSQDSQYQQSTAHPTSQSQYAAGAGAGGQPAYEYGVGEQHVYGGRVSDSPGLRPVSDYTVRQSDPGSLGTYEYGTPSGQDRHAVGAAGIPLQGSAAGAAHAAYGAQHAPGFSDPGAHVPVAELAARSLRALRSPARTPTPHAAAAGAGAGGTPHRAHMAHVPPRRPAAVSSLLDAFSLPTGATHNQQGTRPSVPVAMPPSPQVGYTPAPAHTSGHHPHHPTSNIPTAQASAQALAHGVADAGMHDALSTLWRGAGGRVGPGSEPRSELSRPCTPRDGLHGSNPPQAAGLTGLLAQGQRLGIGVHAEWTGAGATAPRSARTYDSPRGPHAGSVQYEPAVAAAPPPQHHTQRPYPLDQTQPTDKTEGVHVSSDCAFFTSLRSSAGILQGKAIHGTATSAAPSEAGTVRSGASWSQGFHDSMRALGIGTHPGHGDADATSTRAHGTGGQRGVSQSPRVATAYAIVHGVCESSRPSSSPSTDCTLPSAVPYDSLDNTNTTTASHKLSNTPLNTLNPSPNPERAAQTATYKHAISSVDQQGGQAGAGRGLGVQWGSEKRGHGGVSSERGVGMRGGAEDPLFAVYSKLSQSCMSIEDTVGRLAQESSVPAWQRELVFAKDPASAVAAGASLSELQREQRAIQGELAVRSLVKQQLLSSMRSPQQNGSDVPSPVHKRRQVTLPYAV